jgi:uncharacterized membrane protein YgdD (TMEM256/DUF423 family)
MGSSIFFLRLSAALGAAGVALGAFGAHILESRLSAEHLTVFEVGVRYHFIHTLAILALSLASEKFWRTAWSERACWCWFSGTLLFSGSLYVLAVTGISKLGMITPLGGVLFIAGWVCLLFVPGASADN